MTPTPGWNVRWLARRSYQRLSRKRSCVSCSLAMSRARRSRSRVKRMNSKTFCLAPRRSGLLQPCRLERRQRSDNGSSEKTVSIPVLRVRRKKPAAKQCVPAIRELLVQRTKHRLQDAVKKFASPVCLWMVRAGTDLINTQVIQKDLHESRHKIRSLIRQDLLRKDEMTEDVGSVCATF